MAAKLISVIYGAPSSLFSSSNWPLWLLPGAAVAKQAAWGLVAEGVSSRPHNGPGSSSGSSAAPSVATYHL